MACNLPLRATMCHTCPFREGSPYAYLADAIAEEAVTESRICHSTGSNNAIHKKTGIKPHLCRGARDIQLRLMTSLGVIEAPTDEAWNAERSRIGMKPTKVVDPVGRPS